MKLAMTSLCTEAAAFVAVEDYPNNYQKTLCFHSAADKEVVS